MDGIAFEWDRRKNSANRRKHGVGFAEASTVFDDPLSITISDPDHASFEERFVIIGLSSAPYGPVSGDGLPASQAGSICGRNRRTRCGKRYGAT